MTKLTKRKGFNFFRSYYDVYNELKTDADKVAFINALLDRQFLGIKPTNLKGLAKFAYISQTNSIDSQVKGYETKTGTSLTTPTEGGGQGGVVPPTEQVQVQVQVQQVKGKEDTKGDKPPLTLFLDYALENKPLVDEKQVVLKYKAWSENGWKDGNNKPIKNWKTKLLNTIRYMDEVAKPKGQKEIKNFWT